MSYPYSFKGYRLYSKSYVSAAALTHRVNYNTINLESEFPIQHVIGNYYVYVGNYPHLWEILGKENHDENNYIPFEKLPEEVLTYIKLLGIK